MLEITGFILLELWLASWLFILWIAVIDNDDATRDELFLALVFGGFIGPLFIIGGGVDWIERFLPDWLDGWGKRRIWKSQKGEQK